MEPQDIRWKQRFSNYRKALSKLGGAVGYVKHNMPQADDSSDGKEAASVLSDLVKQGLIQSFEYTHELAWKVMKDFLQEVGEVKMYGSKDATREAFAAELITDGDVWMEMIESRNKTSHTYNEEVADGIFLKITDTYFAAFLHFERVMEAKTGGTTQNLF